MNTAGWLKIPRSILVDEQWTKEPFTKGQAWIDLVLLANWEPGAITIQGVVVPVGRGEVGWSEGALAERWRWSVGKVRRFFDELERYGRIDRKRYRQRDRRKSVLTICDYDQFSGDNRRDGMGNDLGDSIGDSIGSKKKRNREREKREKSVVVGQGHGDQTDADAPNTHPKRVSRFSPPSLEEVTAYCSSRQSSVDPERFLDYYTCNGWKVGKNPMKDWKAAVRFWESGETHKPPMTARKPYMHDPGNFLDTIDGAEVSGGPARSLQPRSVRDALIIQGELIARALNEDNSRSEGQINSKRFGEARRALEDQKSVEVENGFVRIVKE